MSHHYQEGGSRCRCEDSLPFCNRCERVRAEAKAEAKAEWIGLLKAMSAEVEEMRVELETAKAEGAAEEREACAKLVFKYLSYNSQRVVSWHEVQDVIEAIRARGAKPCAEWCVAETCKGWPSCREEK